MSRATLTPTFELGLRLDGGDAETGFGADIGCGVALANPKHGVSLEFRARGLLAHESSGFREWGASAGLAWDPRPGTDRGLSLSLRQGWGVSPTGGMDALLGRETLAGLEAGIGYGIGMFGGAFTGTRASGCRRPGATTLAERVRLRSFLLLIAILAAFIYPVIGS